MTCPSQNLIMHNASTIKKETDENGGILELRVYPNCGKSIEEGEKSCKNCGTNIDVDSGKCPRCGKEAGSDDIFCGNCGATLRTSEYHDDRVAEIKHALNDLTDDGEEDSFVIFENPDTKKFVQFMKTEKNIVCDIPLVELSDEEKSKIRLLLDKVVKEERTGEETSYQKNFSTRSIDEAAELVERIFVHVFKLPEDYEIETET